MSPIFITAILGVAVSVMALSQVTPSISNSISAKNVDIGLGRESALTQQIIRYKAVEGAYPATVADLVAKNYWRASDNNNGFGGTYAFTVDSAKNLLSISTTIADASNRAKYLKSYRHVFTPVELASGVVSKTFILPSVNSLGAPLPAAGSIPASVTAPSATTNTYWYDTSGANAILKVSDGANWVAASSGLSGGGGGIAAPSASNILASAAALPATATVGDVRYVYNAASSALETMVYYDGAWVRQGSGANAAVVTNLSAQTLPVARVAESFIYDFKASVSAMFVNTYGALAVNTANVVWAVQGVLPAGLSLNTSTGVLSGTPSTKTVPDGTPFNVIATYSGGSGQQGYMIKVGPTYLRVKSISSGYSTTCAVTISGGAMCWGSNTNGQLGNGTLTPSTLPVSVVGLSSGVASISVGVYHTCAVMTTGGAKCWGDGTAVGDGVGGARKTPVDVLGLTSGVASISAGENYTCAVTTAGGAKCWGQNSNGKLGDGTSTSRPTAVDVVGLTTGTASISVGTSFTCAVTTTGAAKCWGNNYWGNLGDGTKTERATPANVSGLSSGIASISLGAYHVCALTTSGGIKCWGDNALAQFGDGTQVSKLTPVDVSGLTWGVTKLSSGGGFTCAVLTTGEAKCWGYNGQNQLGDGTTNVRTLPITVSGLASGVAGISAGWHHGCVSMDSGEAKCWGENTSSQLGDGTVGTYRSIPVDLFLDIW